jgi:hypothetical protein
VDWQQEKAMVERSLERFDEGTFHVYEWRSGITAAMVADLTIELGRIPEPKAPGP